MPRYVAFLRAVNAGGASTIKMDVLRHAFERLGFSNVASYIASGNIIFETAARSPSQLEMQIERELLETLGQNVLPYVRTRRELAEIVTFDAFSGVRLGPRDQLAVLFLTLPPDAQAAKTLEAFDSKTDRFRVHGREVFWLRLVDPAGVPYSTVPLDKALREPFTIRSMGTLKKVVEKYFSVA